MQKSDVINNPSSFRDPSGFVFEREGILYRQVNQSFKEDFDHFINCGCCNHLQKNGLLLPHEVIYEQLTDTPGYYLTLKPQKIGFISYPWEWSFDVLKDASLLTLRILKESISFGIILKDASPYNIQWLDGKLVFIDTLSFVKYKPELPWVAYRQFCECFLSPLLLMHYKKIPLQQLQLAYPEGIPLSITSSLLPWYSRLSLYTYLHIHLHNHISKKKTKNLDQIIFNQKKLLNLVTSLESLIFSLHLTLKESVWSGYYQEANYNQYYFQQKQNIIKGWIENLTGLNTALDLGANRGEFSKLLASKSIQTIACDFDHASINNLYRDIKKNNEINIQPLIIDLANPSPAIGFNNKERFSFIERCNADISLALALVHHLSIGKNIPLQLIADQFQHFCQLLIIEFVPKSDKKVQEIIGQKRDVYDGYNEENFTKAFEKWFSIIKKKEIGDSGRLLYLMKKK